MKFAEVYMNTSFVLKTERLLISPLTGKYAQFIFELVNTEGWIRFIGDRNVRSLSDASDYIQKILHNKKISYWVVLLTDTHTPIGVVTFIKRDYLEHHDIGFAFLPTHSKKGYAYEAVRAVLKKLILANDLPHILATTFPENTNSISLLKKLGLKFEKEIKPEKETLHVYGVSADKLRG